MPSWQEIAVSASFVVIAFGVFRFGVKYFHLFEGVGGKQHEEMQLDEAARNLSIA